MLVISRRVDESVRFPNLGITVTLLKYSGTRIRLGIDAPPEVAILRGELIKTGASEMPPSPSHPSLNRIREKLRRAAEVLQRLDDMVMSEDWEQSRLHVFSLFRELKQMDEQVAEISFGATSPARPPKRALLVEDNQNESRLLASYLRLKKFDVEVASNGAEAIRIMDESDVPDVVLLDMNMPQFDGRWTVKEMRSNPRYEDVTIFAVSGMDPQACNIELGKPGVDRWLRKPLNPEDLVREISRADHPDLIPAA